MIFLGAGASKVFELKTLQDLTSDLVGKMRDKGHGETIDDILRALKRFRITPDFENIYTTIEALTDLQEGIKKSGALTAYIASVGNFDVRSQPEYKELLSDFRNSIHKECSIQKGIIESKKSIFDNLFKVTLERKEDRLLSSKTGKSFDIRSVDIGETVVTTNYDMAVETYHWSKNIEFCDGFKSTNQKVVNELDFLEYGKHPSSRWLIKLHGSISQFTQGSRIIQTIGSPNSRDFPIDISIGEQMMIYPVGEKPILQEPYYSFYSIFKEQPWEVLIAIGYSFRDEPVNIAILERLKTRPPPKCKLIVVNPNAESVIANLGPINSEIDQRIIRIDKPFEDTQSLFDKIKIAIESKDRKEYETNVPRQSKDSVTA